MFGGAAPPVWWGSPNGLVRTTHQFGVRYAPVLWGIHPPICGYHNAARHMYVALTHWCPSAKYVSADATHVRVADIHVWLGSPTSMMGQRNQFGGGYPPVWWDIPISLVEDTHGGRYPSIYGSPYALRHVHVAAERGCLSVIHVCVDATDVCVAAKHV